MPMPLRADTLGFFCGQRVYGPRADSVGRNLVILFGTFLFALTGATCVLVHCIVLLACCGRCPCGDQCPDMRDVQ
ncbi:hypothetical protein [Edwardsiella ictaluri]|nr:hypothetical protein [Edwardsiella ictaluri]UCQ46767.1 hypothetical protein DB741_11900 [Edwardsiella ictaluri]UCQ50032.1 hypothetical protein DB731_11880 [Edwardsiella ictaluri]UYB63938.1 hypothetical protein N8I67_11745 [Edwardsiella ictaluri]WFN96699.1 hypothetical protein MAY91_00480 [Edwardsiella ictaluri]WFO09375.1 hypothetical protein MAY76_14365 [Edwardsiella ictaluri]